MICTSVETTPAPFRTAMQSLMRVGVSSPRRLTRTSKGTRWQELAWKGNVSGTQDEIKGIQCNRMTCRCSIHKRDRAVWDESSSLQLLPLRLSIGEWTSFSATLPFPPSSRKSPWRASNGVAARLELFTLLMPALQCQCYAPAIRQKTHISCRNTC